MIKLNKFLLDGTHWSCLDLACFDEIFQIEHQTIEFHKINLDLFLL
jgi:hypothetical protein